MEIENQHPYKYMDIITGDIFDKEDKPENYPDLVPIDIEIIPLIQIIAFNKCYESIYSCQGGLIFDEESECFKDTNMLTGIDHPYVVVHTYSYEEFIRLVDALVHYTIFSFTVNTSDTNDISGTKKDYKINISMSDEFITSLFELETVTKRISDNYGLIKFTIKNIFENNRDKWMTTLINIFNELDK